MPVTSSPIRSPNPSTRRSTDSPSAGTHSNEATSGVPSRTPGATETSHTNPTACGRTETGNAQLSERRWPTRHTTATTA